MSRRNRKPFEYLLWTAGVVLLGYAGYVAVDGQLAQRNASQNLDRILSNQRQENIPRPKLHKAPPHGDMVGRVEIPRLSLSLIALEGTDEPVLKLGVGHWVGSSMPGDPGNIVLTAHRDTFFRKLKDIQKGDEIALITPDSARRYVVDSTKLIDSSETQFLNTTSTPTLTLITGYPFYFVGHAPKRFVVLAHPVPGLERPASQIATMTKHPPELVTAEVAKAQQISQARNPGRPGSPASAQEFKLIELPQPPYEKSKRGFSAARMFGKLNIFAKKKAESTLADARE